tara:strand:- start:1621 stop:1854 length:234 start_codon:yes stop_codon:yes gene_type:complete
MSDVITCAMSGAGPYQSTTINNGGVLVGSPQGSGFLNTNYTFGAGYNGADTTASALPATGTVYSTYDTRITGCPPCS